MKRKEIRVKGATSKRYSEAFKQAMVTELESGRMTAQEVQKRYGIRGAMTIRGWLSRYGKRRTVNGSGARKNLSLPASDRVERENRELKSALAHVTMEKVLLESLIAEANERLGIDIKKNFGVRR